MNRVALESISSQIRDLQGFCRITRSTFFEQYVMRQVFGDICESLDEILTGMGELCETTNSPSNPTEGNRGLSLIQ